MNIPRIPRCPYRYASTTRAGGNITLPNPHETKLDLDSIDAVTSAHVRDSMPSLVNAGSGRLASMDDIRTVVRNRQFDGLARVVK